MGKYAKKCTSLSKCKDRRKRKYPSAKIQGGGQKGNIFQKLRNLNEENVTLQNIFCLKDFFIFA